MKLVTVLVCWLSVALADVISYNNHVISPGHPEYLLIQKYTKKDAPSWSPGKGHSFIDLSQVSVQIDCSSIGSPTQQSECDSSTVKFQILMFEAPEDKSWSDYWPDQTYCCGAAELEAEE